jgi:hypothetical protein
LPPLIESSTCFVPKENIYINKSQSKEQKWKTDEKIDTWPPTARNSNRLLSLARRIFFSLWLLYRSMGYIINNKSRLQRMLVMKEIPHSHMKSISLAHQECQQQIISLCQQYP